MINACGMCLNSCPFAAIVDKGQIYQTIKAIQSDTPVYAIVAPSIAGQFGKDLTDTRMKSAFRKLGFKSVYEVAVGADLCTIQEAGHFMKQVPDECYKLMKKAAAGEYDGYLLEGMACPGGCIAGAGTIQPLNKTVHSLNKAKEKAPVANAVDNKYADLLPKLENIQEELAGQENS